MAAPTQLTMQVPREEAKQVRKQVATGDSVALWDVALVRTGEQVHVRAIYRDHGWSETAAEHTVSWSGVDVIRVNFDIVPSAIGQGAQLLLELEPEPVDSFTEWLDDAIGIGQSRSPAVSRYAGETDEELRERMLLTHEEKPAQELTEAEGRVDAADPRPRVTIDQARRAVGLDPLGAPYGDMTLAEFDEKYNKPETDEELRERLLTVLRSMTAISTSAYGVAERASGIELERVAAIHGVRRKVVTTQPELKPRPTEPPTRDELVEAEREAGELLGELTEFGCDGHAVISPKFLVSNVGKQWCYENSWDGGSVSILDGDGNEIEVPLGSVTFDSSGSAQSRECCVTCAGTGECEQMVCYGDMPVERMGECPDCGGTGKV